jgi:hypothetical protein
LGQSRAAKATLAGNKIQLIHYQEKLAFSEQVARTQRWGFCHAAEVELIPQQVNTTLQYSLDGIESFPTLTPDS